MNKAKGSFRTALMVAGAGVAFLSYHAIAQVVAAGDGPVPAAGTEPSAEQLSRLLMTETGQLQPNALTEDFEAAMMFVIGQQSYAAPTIQNALDLIDARTDISSTFRSAIRLVRLAAMQRNTRGTAALASGGDPAVGTEEITFPILSIDDGSSNYEG